MSTSREAISDPNTSEEELVHELQALGSVSEEPGFWTRLANEPGFPSRHRQHFAFQLLHRHATPGRRLEELLTLVRALDWVSLEDIEIVGDLGGSIPVSVGDEETVIVIRLVPEPGHEIWAVYLRLAARIEAYELRRLVEERKVSSEVGSAVLLEIGFSPPVIDSTP